MAVSHPAQDREAQARQSSADPSVNPAEAVEMAAAALDTPGDPTSPLPTEQRIDTPPPPPAQPEPPRRPRLGSPADDRRSEIAARIKSGRQAEQQEAEAEAGELRAAGLEHANLPEELRAAPPEPEPVAPAPESPPLPQEPAVVAKHTLVVRGQEVEITEEELRAAAQRGMAGDDYFDEAKAKAKEASELLRSVQEQVQRGTSPAGTHPAQPPTAPVAEPQPQPGENDEHPVDPFVALVEKLQFGAPEDAARELRTAFTQTVDSVAGEKAKQTLINERLRDEQVRSQAALSSFQEKHPEFKDDYLAQAAIERRIYDLYGEDLKKLGIKDDQMPKTPNDVADWHRYYRAHGFQVRKFDEVLQKAVDDVSTWKGVPQQPADPQPAATPPPGAPRIEVAVNRDARRAAIPQQPTRTATPKPAETPRPVETDRSSIVQAMIERRRAPRSW